MVQRLRTATVASLVLCRHFWACRRAATRTPTPTTWSCTTTSSHHHVVHHH